MLDHLLEKPMAIVIGITLAAAVGCAVFCYLCMKAFNSAGVFSMFNTAPSSPFNPLYWSARRTVEWTTPPLSQVRLNLDMKE